MNLKLFQIKGKHKKDGKWSKLEMDFAGYYFLNPDDNHLFGYIEEFSNYPNTLSFSIAGINLIKDNKEQLVFVKLNNSIDSPILYSFPDINKKGEFIESSPINSLMEDSQGKTKIKVTEVENEKKLLEVQEDFKNFLANLSTTNFELIRKIDDFIYFLN